MFAERSGLAFPFPFDQLNGLQTNHKLWQDKSHDGIAENFRMLNCPSKGAPVGCVDGGCMAMVLEGLLFMSRCILKLWIHDTH